MPYRLNMSVISPSSMTHPMRNLLFIFLVSLFVMSGMWGCTPAFVKGTDIDYTPQRQEIADFVEKYRVALEQRDFDTLKDMVSSNYYENASTTDTPEDDYGFTGFLEWSQKMKASIKAVKYSLKLLKIEVMEKNAVVDVEIRSQYLFTYNERDRWDTFVDKNRLTLNKDKLGHWKILSGL